VSLRVIYEEKAINQAAGFLADDPADTGPAINAGQGYPTKISPGLPGPLLQPAQPVRHGHGKEGRPIRPPDSRRGELMI
jgi:hypothetical protein